MFSRRHDIPSRTSREWEGEARQDDDGLDDVAPFDVCEGVVLGGRDREERFEELLASFEAPGKRYRVEVVRVLVGDRAEKGEIVAEDIDG